MAWTAPRTWVIGEQVTAALMNSAIRDNMLETAPAKATTDGGLFMATGTNVIAEKLWTTWSPSYTNLTIGNGTVVSRFIEAGKLIIARWRFDLGSTSSVGTDPTVSPPVTASSSAYDSNGIPIGTTYLKESGGNLFPGVCQLDSTTTIGIEVQNATSTHLLINSITASVPFTWGASDVMSFTAVYEAA